MLGHPNQSERRIHSRCIGRFDRSGTSRAVATPMTPAYSPLCHGLTMVIAFCTGTCCRVWNAMTAELARGD
jgi:hypothetical protein